MGMILGTWASKRVIERLPVELFQQFVTVLLGIIAAQMGYYCPTPENVKSA
jgi:hypothetical protein